jgi:hypothetical protein
LFHTHCHDTIRRQRPSLYAVRPLELQAHYRPPGIEANNCVQGRKVPLTLISGTETT